MEPNVNPFAIESVAVWVALAVPTGSVGAV
jgi:hypothetical protein